MGKKNLESTIKYEALFRNISTYGHDLSYAERYELFHLIDRGLTELKSNLAQMWYTEINLVDLAGILTYVLHSEMYPPDEKQDFIAQLIIFFNRNELIPEGCEHLSQEQICLAAIYMSICQSGGVFQNPEDAKKFVHLLLNRLGADIHFGYAQGNTPLVWAIANACVDEQIQLLSIISSVPNRQLFIEHIDTHYKTYCQGSALFLACAKGPSHRDSQLEYKKPMRELIDILLEFGADPLNRCDAQPHLTPLGMMTLQKDLVYLEKLFAHANKNSIAPELLEELKALNEYSYEDAKQIHFEAAGGTMTFPTYEAWSSQKEAISDFLTSQENALSLTSHPST